MTEWEMEKAWYEAMPAPCTIHARHEAHLYVNTQDKYNCFACFLFMSYVRVHKDD